MSKKIVFSFGRMNPPTIGHEKLADKVKSVGKSENADVRIYLSHSSGSRTKSGENKDPLDYATKLRFAKKAFGTAVHKSNAKTVIQILKELESSKYTDIVMVVGSDRVAEFKGLLNKYNGKDYNFNSIKIVSAGARDPDAVGVEGMSASKLRGIAKAGDDKTFKQGLPSGLSDRDRQALYDIVNRELNEEMTEEALNIQQRIARGRVMKRNAKKIARMRKIKSKRRADNETLMKRARKKAIEVMRKKIAGDRGVNYRSLSSSEKQTIDKMVAKKKSQVDRIAKKLLNKVRKGETERLARARSQKNEGVELKTFGSLFEGAAQDKAKDLIKREKELDKQKHDRMMDSARISDAQKKNRTTEEKDTHTTKDGRTAKKGLWYNINQKKKRGEKPNPPGHPDRPTAQDFKNSQKEEAVSESFAANTWGWYNDRKKNLPVSAEKKYKEHLKLYKRAEDELNTNKYEKGSQPYYRAQIALKHHRKELDKMLKTRPLLKKLIGEEINELSTDKLLKYKQKSDYSKERAKNSKVAHALRKSDDSKDDETLRKRKRGDDLFKKKAFRSIREEGGAGEYGTDKLRKKYAKETPMERMDPKLAMMNKAVEALHRRAQSKGDKQTIGGYAFDVARSFNGITSKELEKEYKKKYGDS